MKRSYLIAILIPLLLGFIGGLVFNYTNLSNPILYLRADAGTLTFISGFTLSFLVFIYLSVRELVTNIQESSTQEAELEKRQFIQRLDHEIKNPLTAMMVGIANLKQDTKKNPTLDSIESQVKRLSRLMVELRKLSDLELRPLETSSVNLNQLLPEVFEIAKSHKYGNERQFNLQIPQAPWPLPNIDADRDLLFLSIHNLLDNAIKYSKPEDTIELRATEEDHTILIEVADTGPGIPEDEIKYIWGELFRGSEARGIEGSGLGLALVEAIIKRHQGTIKARSRKGQGTVFEIRLPKVTDL